MSKVLTYVSEIPLDILFKLSEILDPGKAWTDVGKASNAGEYMVHSAKSMPDVLPYDIDACAATSRPTESLLRIWGSKGYKVVDLFKVFGKCQYTMILFLVDPKWASIMMTADKSVFSPKSTQPNESTNRLDNTQPSQQPSTVYSKKGAPQIDPHLLSEGTSVQSSNEILTGLQTVPAVHYEEILSATNNFAEEKICGKGGYGVVYKGVWKHTDVAVKRIRSKKETASEQQKERIRQSLQELRHLSKLRHDNILLLYGYSMDGPEPCLIYQYMPGGSLEDRILCRNNTPPLTWETRKTICLGSALGLNFLHCIGNAPIIHGDVKCANILLDKHMEPKLGDFGLSRDGQVELDADEKAPMIASHIKGTLAYLPPEFTRSKILTTKLDVFSFGVVLLEVATGLRAYSDSRKPQGLVPFVSQNINNIQKTGASTSEIVAALSDKRVPITGKGVDEAIFLKLLDLGSKCSVEDMRKRPPFSELVESFRAE